MSDRLLAYLSLLLPIVCICSCGVDRQPLLLLNREAAVEVANGYCMSRVQTHDSLGVMLSSTNYQNGECVVKHWFAEQTLNTKGLYVEVAATKDGEQGKPVILGYSFSILWLLDSATDTTTVLPEILLP